MRYRIAAAFGILCILAGVGMLYNNWRIYQQYPHEMAAQLGLTEDNSLQYYRLFNMADIFQKYPIYHMVYEKDITSVELQREIEKLNLSHMKYNIVINPTNPRGQLVYVFNSYFGKELKVNGVIDYEYYKNTKEHPTVYRWTGYNDNQDAISISLIETKGDGNIYTVNDKEFKYNIIMVVKSTRIGDKPFREEK